jgi:hypothetical protein
MSLAQAHPDQKFSPKDLAGHLAVLAEKVFQTATKWPHFDLLLADVRRLADEMPVGATVVSMERGLLYGGCSLIAPFFQNHDFIALDCSPTSADARGAYNGAMIDDPRFLFVPTTHRGAIDETGLASGQADLVLVPNLVHHVADQQGLFENLRASCGPAAGSMSLGRCCASCTRSPTIICAGRPMGWPAPCRMQV